MSSGQDVSVVYVPVSGALTVSTGVLRYVVPFAAEVVDVQAQVDTAPTGADAHFSLKVNGAVKATVVVPATSHAATELRTTPGVAPGANVPGGEVPNPTPVASVSKGDYLTVDVTQVGSTVAGSNAVLALTLVRL